MNAETATTNDYIYCETCDEFVDFWKYNHNIDDAGHNGCMWRYVTEEELKDCIQACKDWDCFGEQFVEPVMIIVAGEHKTAMSEMDSIILRAS